MGLLNQNSGVFYDPEGNIFSFILSGEEIYYSIWYKNSDKKINEVLASGVEDIKICSDGAGGLYLFCYDREGDIQIYYADKEKIESSKLRLRGSEMVFRDFRPYIAQDRCEILISQSKKDNRNERILTKYSVNIKDIMKKDFDYTTKNIMEYCTFGPVDEIAVISQDESCSKIISVIEKNEDSNSIILLKDNRFGYMEGLIKMSMEADIFWHDIIVKGNDVMIAFTQQDEEFFTIKFVIYDMKAHELSSECVVRERGSCSHPVFVDYMGKLWICWYENGSVHSCVINDGRIVEGPLKWKDSTGKRIMCAAFIIDNYDIKRKYGFNCRKVFITYPENNMTGFGRI